MKIKYHHSENRFLQGFTIKILTVEFNKIFNYSKYSLPCGKNLA